MKLIDGKIVFDIHDALEQLIPKHKAELVETLACDDDIIKFVTQQVIDGWTDSGFHGSTFCSAQPAPTRGLDWARREIAKASGDIAKQEIESLEKELSDLNRRFYELANERRA